VIQSWFKSNHDLDLPITDSSDSDLCLCNSGWFRQCGLIPYSKDVDIGIWIAEYSDKLISGMQNNGLELVHRFGKVRFLSWLIWLKVVFKISTCDWQCDYSSVQSDMAFVVLHKGIIYLSKVSKILMASHWTISDLNLTNFWDTLH